MRNIFHSDAVVALLTVDVGDDQLTFPVRFDLDSEETCDGDGFSDSTFWIAYSVSNIRSMHPEFNSLIESAADFFGQYLYADFPKRSWGGIEIEKFSTR